MRSGKRATNVVSGEHLAIEANVPLAHEAGQWIRDSGKRRRSVCAAHALGESGSNALDDLLPIACARLPENSHRRIPRAVLAIEEPPPAAVISRQHPGRNSKASGEVSNRGVDGDDEIRRPA
jgi:hypothetical protein